ncbi:type VI secretion system protein [Magnetospirillum sulfuroxidans]|uniref:Type VI secretion system component TssM1 N-terminal domain-containing protein n=1 Tax=Magnetospirillum sulfuroxidans TaxID=611300 RepID=A0ABS5ICI5_9PROT|nr:type VI secretion system protein [Magnetospirillum sulfuroxidans]MBR9972001.1 hypothetical protein [Magnetospirillum sulfuroxidans]
MTAAATLAAEPQNWLPWLVLAVVALLMSATIAVLWWLLRKKPAAAAPAATDAAVPEDDADRWETTYMRRDVRRSLQTLSRLSDSGGNPYSVPWIVAVGATGADSRGMIQAIAPHSDLSGSTIPSAGSVHFCRQGAVFHAGDDLLENNGGLRRWRRLIRLMTAARPHRPVDGVVLALPATMLSGPEAIAFDTLADLGARLSAMIASVQSITGLRVPVTVVISGCDRLQGFAALVSALSEETLSDALGWAMPFAMETAYQAEWAELATETIAAGLSDTSIQLLMAGTSVTDADGLLLLPTEIRRLTMRLKPLMAAMFQPSAYHEAFLFRGLYLTGKRPGETTNWAFVSGLFEGKAFREYQLVQPVRGILTARTKKLRITQAVLALTLVAEALGLTWLSYDAPFRAENLRHLLATINSDLTSRVQAEGRQNADVAQGAAIRLLQELTRLEVSTLATPLAPASYLQSPDSQLEGAIAVGYNAIIVDEIRTRLGNRLRNIVSMPALDGASDDVIMKQLERMVRELAEFDRIYRVYQDLPTLRSAAALALVSRYALAIELPPDFHENAELYQRAMGFSAVPPLEQAPELIGRSLKTHFTTAFRNRFNDGRLQQRFEQIAKLSGSNQPHNPMDAMDRLTQLQTLLAGISNDLDSRDYGWINGEGHDIGPAFDTMLAQLDGLGLVSDDDLGQIRKTGENQIVSARQALFRRLNAQRIEQMQLNGTKAVLSQALQSLRTQLDALLARPFMSEALPSQPELRSGQRPIVWNAQWLKKTHQMVDDYLAFAATEALNFPPELSFTVEMAAFDQASQRTLTALSAAAQPAERVMSGAYDMEAELRGLIGISQTLAGIADQLRLAKMDYASSQLRGTVHTQTLRLLSDVDGLSTGLLLTAPPPEFDWWDGSMPVAARAFRVPSLPELSLLVEANRDSLSKLIHEYVAPLLKILATIPGEGGRSESVARWQSITRSLQRYEQKDRDSSLRRLEQFLLVDMDQISPSNCANVANGPPTPGGDMFAMHLDQLKRNLAQRCEALGTNRVRDSYAQVQTHFNETLAGRFPFAREAKPAVPRADPLAVRQFFWSLEQNPLPAGAILQAAAGRPAAAFAAELAAARKILAPMLVDPTLEQPLIYEVEAEFRTNPAQDVGGNQIIEWGVEFGGDQWVSSREAKRMAVWSIGQPARLFVRFARNAPSIPAPDPLGRYRVDGTMATWEAHDPWALLSLIQELSPEPGRLHELADRRPQTLALTLDLQRNPDAAPGATSAPNATLYLRLGLTGVLHKAGKPDEKQTVQLSPFPVAAPRLEDTQPLKIVR